MDTHFLLQQTVWHEPTTPDKDVAGAGVPASLFLWSSRGAPRTGILSPSYSTHTFYVGKTSVSLWSWMKFMFWNRIKHIFNVVWIDYTEYK